MPRFKLLHLMIATALVAAALVLLQQTNFSDQYYATDLENNLRRFAYGTTLAVSVAVASFAGSSHRSARIDWAGRLAGSGTAAAIAALALTPSLVAHGYSRVAVFASAAFILIGPSLAAAVLVRHLRLLSLFIVLATLCATEFASYQILTYEPSLHRGMMRLHAIAIWLYVIPIGLWCAAALRSLKSNSGTRLTGVLLFSPLVLLVAAGLSERVYERLWLHAGG